MTLEEYAARQAQQPQEAQQAEGNQLDAVAARIDAERLSSLVVDARAAIDEYRSPATLLTVITGAIFGENSAEAAAVAETIKQDRTPGGYELTIAGLRETRRLLKQQSKKLGEQQQEIAAAIEKTIEAEREIMAAQAEAGAVDGALIEIMTFCNSETRENLLQGLADLYEKHHSKPAAMGLLYGSIGALTRQSSLDLLQQQELAELKARILEAAQA